MRVDPCESLPIIGIVTSHLHPKERKKRAKRREKELRERERVPREESLTLKTTQNPL
jgi:hypothetical protein